MHQRWRFFDRTPDVNDREDPEDSRRYYKVRLHSPPSASAGRSIECLDPAAATPSNRIESRVVAVATAYRQMTDHSRDYLIRQLDTAWKLTTYHLDGLTTEECLWRPAAVGLHVHRETDGSWTADWPEQEGYDIGPPSIAWITWHIGFWWSMVVNHSFGDGSLSRTDIRWPGSANDVRSWISRLHDEWRAALSMLDAEDLRSTDRTQWPFQNRPFGDVVAWVTLELTKNAAEIGFVRFLYAARER